MISALDIVLAYAKLPSQEQSKVNDLLTIISQDRKALSILQNQVLDQSGSLRTEMVEVPKTNVINVPFGVPKLKRGVKPKENGPTNLAKQFLAEFPNGSAQDMRDFCLTRNPMVNMSSVAGIVSKLRRGLIAA